MRPARVFGVLAREVSGEQSSTVEKIRFFISITGKAIPGDTSCRNIRIAEFRRPMKVERRGEPTRITIQESEQNNYLGEVQGAWATLAW